MNKNAEYLLESLQECPVIDTHEHLENEWNQPDFGALGDYTRHYFSCDLISAGLEPRAIERLREPDLSPQEKWRSLAPYWDYCRATGYGQMLDEAARALYGVAEINADTVAEVERGFRALRAKPGYGQYIMRDLCHIEHCMDNVWHLKGDDLGGFFWFAAQIDGWVLGDWQGLGFAERDIAGIADVDDWAALCLHTLGEDFADRNARMLKMGLAYARTLDFENASHTAAQADFAPFARGERPGKAAQDYVLHRILAWANERELILQIHTGYQEGNDNTIAQTDPLLLNPLFGAYPRVRFDLFHMGYPYQSAMGALGKMYPNVRLDMCWTHILAPVAARNALHEWLGCVPANKIFAFGGDCLFYDGVLGHLRLAKRNVASALALCVEDGMFSLARAERIAQMLFYDNPKAFYGM